MKRLVFSVASGLTLVFLGACEQDTVEDTGQPLRVNAAIAAVVNGEYILASEVELEAAAQGLLDSGERLEVDDPTFEDILEQLVDQKLLAQEALNRGLDQDESARHRLHAARERILGNILVEQLVAEEVDEKAILEMYDAQTELTQLSEEVLIRHIQVDTEAEARDLHNKLKSGGEFAELAFNHSTDRRTSAEGGLIGYVLPEEMSDEFTREINRVAVGAVSQPFESELGWHILKVEDRRREEPPSLDELRPKIMQYLTLSEISKSIKRLRSRAEIQTITGQDPMTVFEEPLAPEEGNMTDDMGGGDDMSETTGDDAAQDDSQQPADETEVEETE